MDNNLSKDPQQTSTEQPALTPPQEGTSQVLQPEPPKPKSKKTLFIALVLILICGGAAAVWWFLLRKDTPADSTKQDNSSTVSNNQTPQEADDPSPKYLIYSPTNTELTQYSIRDGQKVSGLKVEEGAVTSTLLSGNYVYALVEGASGQQVWISKDAGKSYQKALQLDITDKLEAVTSAVFSSDNKSLLVALKVTNAGGHTNTIKEIDLDGFAAKDVFALPVAGVFLYGYNAKTGDIYYHTGCFQCDGVSTGGLLSYNKASGKKDTIFEDDEKSVGLDIRLNKDLTKALLITGQPSDDDLIGEFVGPYVVTETDIAAKTTVKLKEIASNDAKRVGVGYSEEGKAYYYVDKELKYASNDTVLLESGQGISSVIYVSEDAIYAVTGDDLNMAMVRFVIASSKFETLFSSQGTSDQSAARVYGVISGS